MPPCPPPSASRTYTSSSSSSSSPKRSAPLPRTTTQPPLSSPLYNPSASRSCPHGRAEWASLTRTSPHLLVITLSHNLRYLPPSALVSRPGLLAVFGDHERERITSEPAVHIIRAAAVTGVARAAAQRGPRRLPAGRCCAVRLEASPSPLIPHPHPLPLSPLHPLHHRGPPPNPPPVAARSPQPRQRAVCAPVMSAAVVRHGARCTRVTKLVRLPSTLYGVSVSKGHLLADYVQRGALPQLDALICHLPAYESDLHAYASALAVWERARSVADERRT